MLPGPTVKDFEEGTYKAGDYKGYCGCGWPKNLLLPRGTHAGMKVSLYVLVTDWSKDRVDSEQLKSSVAYCGKQDIPFPDKRPMGFPFDRPLHFDTLQDMVNGVDNSATADVLIKYDFVVKDPKIPASND
jgi:hypothetical protein